MFTARSIYYAVHGTRPSRRAPRTWGARKPARAAKYRAWIGSLPCAACGTERGVQAAHTQHNGMASKGSDYSCVPLCFACHREFDSGLRSKDLFEADHNLNLAELVRRLNHDWFAYSRLVK